MIVQIHTTFKEFRYNIICIKFICLIVYVYIRDLLLIYIFVFILVF